MKHFFLVLTLTFSIFANAQPPDVEAKDTPILDQGPVSTYLDKQDEQILQRHRPFYFAYGDPLSKLQLSFKTPLLTDLPLYFAYTQSMFWALTEESKPFRDLTFNPEIFYRWKRGRTGFESVDFGLFSHSSNGKSDLDSRSLNLSYVRFNFSTEGRRWMTRLGVELQGIFDTEKNNSDIYNYVGPLSLNLAFVQLFDGYIFDKSEVSFSAIPGGKWATDWHKGGYQATWAFRFNPLKIVPAFYVQYYTGYAETLLYYNRQTHAMRAGVIF